MSSLDLRCDRRPGMWPFSPPVRFFASLGKRLLSPSGPSAPGIGGILFLCCVGLGIKRFCECSQLVLRIVGLALFAVNPESFSSTLSFHSCCVSLGCLGFAKYDSMS